MDNGGSTAAECDKPIEGSAFGPGRNGFGEARIATPGRRDEPAGQPQHILGDRLADYHLPAAGHSEISSVEQEFARHGAQWRDRRCPIRVQPDHAVLRVP